ncbi:MAG: rhamnulokinase [Oscillospiraceae bacterium]|nr:rhamnulokinase [Oscillospiraceae bacterium]
MMGNKNSKNALAIDLGASSGRAVLGSFDGQSVTMREVHRFENQPVKLGNTLYWDIFRLFHEVKTGISKAVQAGGFESIGVDTWGVDFALIDKSGSLLEAPVHYRDSRTDNMEEEAFKYIDRERLYSLTGNQIMPINTAFQLLSLKKNRPHILDCADKMLMLPDFFNYLLSGEIATELSIASTTQLLDMNSAKWSEEVINSLGLPRRLFTDIVPSGTVVGELRRDLCEELGVSTAKSVKVTAVCGHDTQCAVAAVPADRDRNKDFIFISCGTWSLFGTELSSAIINEKSARYNLTNELGYGGKVSFLKNITGLWKVQELRRKYRREGKDYTFPELESLPETREIYKELTAEYKKTLDEICDCTGKDYDTIHIVGGGAKSKMLCEMTADVCGCEVKAGESEATALGNITIQLTNS